MKRVVEFVLPVTGTSTYVHYGSGTSIRIQYYFAYEQAKHPFEKKKASLFEEKIILAEIDPKQLLTADFVFHICGKYFESKVILNILNSISKLNSTDLIALYTVMALTGCKRSSRTRPP